MSISSDGRLSRTDAGEAERVPAIARDWVDADEGVQRKVLGEEPELMLVEFRFTAGAVGKRHHHPHVQSTFVRSGVFEFSVGDVTHRLNAGDSLVIPSNVEHGCRAIEEGSLIDTFAPRRDDFL